MSEITRIDIPYKNLVLTGYVGVGKSTVGRAIGQKLEIQTFDVDEEIELRELMSIAKLREQYGDARLRALEHDLCREAALIRQAVIVVSGAALLDSRNYRILSETGSIVCLACELGEALRRLHAASEVHFRDETIRRRLLGRMRREYAIIEREDILQLETTHLTIEEEVTLLIRYWKDGEPNDERFRYGPPPRIKPPAPRIAGVSALEAQRDVRRRVGPPGGGVNEPE
jgi:shikimate kinase